jgi:membrane-associated phospholipid phosphatase
MATRQSGSPQNVTASLSEPTPRSLAWRVTELRTRQKPLLGIVSNAATCAILVVASATLVDRPVATWVHEHLGDARFGWFTGNYGGYLLTLGPFSLMAAPAQALESLAVLVFLVLVVAASTGWLPGIRARIVLTLCLAIFAVTAITSVAKAVFGRTWPESWLGDNPSWIRDGVFGFFPFHQGAGWGSFPSGHTAVTTATATILWLVWPELRVLWVMLLAVVVAGLIGANYHFVSDIIGGLYLGVAVGLGIARLMLSPSDRLASTRRSR